MINFKMFSGEDRTLLITVTNPPSLPAGPYNLSGKSLITMAKTLPERQPDREALFNFSTVTGEIVIQDPPEDGILTIFLAGTVTQDLEGIYTIGLKLFPGALEILEFTLTIEVPVVRTIVAP